jgi:hypothetical protein
MDGGGEIRPQLKNNMPSYKRILRLLIKEKHKPIEYSIDRLSLYRLRNLEETIDKVITLAKQGVIKLRKTEKGFMCEVKAKEGKNEKDTEAE